MTDCFPDGGASAVQPALRPVGEGNAEETDLNTLARGVVLIPAGTVTAESENPGTVRPPVHE